MYIQVLKKPPIGALGPRRGQWPYLKPDFDFRRFHAACSKSVFIQGALKKKRKRHHDGNCQLWRPTYLPPRAPPRFELGLLVTPAPHLRHTCATSCATLAPPLRHPCATPAPHLAHTPASRPCFRRNLISCRSKLRENQTGLPNHNPKPTPAWLGGAIARFSATPLPGRLRLGRRADGQPSRRITDELTSRQAHECQGIEPSSFTLTPRMVPDTPRECGVPTPPRSTFRLLSSLALSRAWPFAVAPPRFSDATATSPAPF